MLPATALPGRTTNAVSASAGSRNATVINACPMRPWAPTIVSFNHSLSEVFNALWSAGLTVTLFEEHQSVPWNPLAGEMVEFEPNEFRLREMPERLAATYTLRAVKN